MTLYQHPIPSIAGPIGDNVGVMQQDLHRQAPEELHSSFDPRGAFGTSPQVIDEAFHPSFSAAGSSASASLDLYITAAHREPMLSHEAEQLLWADVVMGRPGACNADGTPATSTQIARARAATEALTRSHLRLVVSTARQFAGYGLSHADLIQEGTVGLLKAIERFDTANGARLSTYALHWIRAEIQEHIVRNMRMVKMATTKPMRKLFFNLRAMVRSMRQAGEDRDSDAVYGKNLTSQEVDRIAKQLNVEADDVREMHLRLSGSDYSVEYITDEPEDGSTNRLRGMSAWLADTSASPDVLLQRRRSQWQAHEGVQLGLLTLDPRSRDIIESRWLVEEDESKLTLHDLADRYGVSAERIRQIESAALKKLRAYLGPSQAMN